MSLKGKIYLALNFHHILFDNLSIPRAAAATMCCVLVLLWVNCQSSTKNQITKLTAPHTKHALNIKHCTLHTAHCMLHTAHCTLHAAH